jgi:hypothetical protein
MARYSFVPLFREAEFYGVPSRVVDKLLLAADEKKGARQLQNSPITTEDFPF